MAITITVEDGTIVAGANSYVSVSDAKAYASDRGVSLPAADDAVAAMLLKAMDYLVQYRDKWKGVIVSSVQTLPWPRDGAYITEPYLWPNDEIPMELIHAQAQLVLAVDAGVDLSPTIIAGLPIIREKLGPIETEYAAPSMLGSVGWQTNDFPTVKALLAPLLKAGGFRLRSVRI